MPRRAVLPFALASILASSAFAAAAQQADPASDATRPVPQAATDLPRIEVHGYDWRRYVAAKLKHQMAEVAGTRITVTRKTTVTHLDLQPTVIGNHLEQLLAHSPGVLVS
ncbi:MAG: hypothetical protein KGN77_15515, partial [Xanthomonadaceae bacterium]|nr:hypothetical protein [Xanthomonadaceae bacterium]